ncbi:MAG TPA: FMN-binding protein [Ruminococcaceae bacterium]|nr:FMN-binding protein [Oscillospiraceae bacterium]
MKKKTIIILSVVAVFIITGFLGAYQLIREMQKNMAVVSDMQIEDVDISTVSDGTYEGSYGTTLVRASVELTIKGHKITDIKLTKHDNGMGKAAESIPDMVVKSGTLQVDTVSGATYSSKVILKAIENALNQAVNS